MFGGAWITCYICHVYSQSYHLITITQTNTVINNLIDLTGREQCHNMCVKMSVFATSAMGVGCYQGVAGVDNIVRSDSIQALATHHHHTTTQDKASLLVLMDDLIDTATQPLDEERCSRF